MLVELHVENFGLLEDILLSFNPGLTVFTGETGAGKSMLVDALAVLLGSRVSAEMIRHGEERAKIEGIFTNLPEPVLLKLREAGYAPEEDELILYREVNASGRNSCRVQGRAVPLSLYRSLCEGLVDIHGQMEHQSLLRPETHRDLLDALGGPAQLTLREEVTRAARTCQAISKQEKELLVSEAERQSREELLTYQLREIDQVKPLSGEEEELNAEKKILSNAEKIMSLSGEVYEALYKGTARGPAAYDLLGISLKALSELARLDESSAGMLESAETLYYSLEDLTEQVRSYQENFEFEPGRLDKIEERLAQLHRLRKYGRDVEQILAKRRDLQQELDDLNQLQDQLAEIGGTKAEALAEYKELAGRLTKERLLQAERLEKGLAEELEDLGLDGSVMKVLVTPLADPRPAGEEDIEFYFSANPGEPPKPLAKVASGGEMSRLMLALKTLLARVEQVGTFVFDEVDSGVGGRTVQKVGEKLSMIAGSNQVFCITHAAAVAAYADEHFGISKEIKEGKTRTMVEHLDQDARIEELARMLGGEGEMTLRHARELWQKRAVGRR